MILAMNIAQISLFVICVEVIIYLLLENLHDCTFKECHATGQTLLIVILIVLDTDRQYSKLI